MGIAMFLLIAVGQHFHASFWPMASFPGFFIALGHSQWLSNTLQELPRDYPISFLWAFPNSFPILF
jgi:hypothetical protein